MWMKPTGQQLAEAIMPCLEGGRALPHWSEVKGTMEKIEAALTKAGGNLDDLCNRLHIEKLTQYVGSKEDLASAIKEFYPKKEN
jgi:hypothetical protein